MHEWVPNGPKNRKFQNKAAQIKETDPVSSKFAINPHIWWQENEGLRGHVEFDKSCFLEETIIG